MVPIRNLYNLLCYAWNFPQGVGAVDVGDVDGDRVQDLLATMLVRAADDLLRRGLDRSYVVEDDDLRAPRGKIQISETIGRALDRSSRVSCAFDELSYDVLHNRILRASALRLSRCQLNPVLERRLCTMVRRMPIVRDVPLSPSLFSRVTLHRNNVRYRFALQICELIVWSSIPDESGTGRRFVDVRGDDAMMGLLFEQFVRSFLRLEQSAFRVKRQSPVWAAVCAPEVRHLLPGMQTDISLSRVGRHVVIETKAVTGPLRPGRDGRRRLRESNLYQLFAYLKNLRAAGHPQDLGVLLYVEDIDRIDASFLLDGESVRVATIDLRQDWTQIKTDLLALSASFNAEAAVAA